MTEETTQIAPGVAPETAATPRLVAPPLWALLPILFSAVLATAFGSFLLARDASRFVGFWPAAGLVVGALLLSDQRRWPALIATAVAATTVFNAWNGQPPAMLAGFALVNATGELLAAHLARRLCRGPPDLGKVRDALKLLSVASFLASLASGLLAATLLHASRGLPFAETWFGIWIGTGLGILVVAPAVLTWAGPFGERPAAGRVLEAMALAALLAGTCAVVFGRAGHGLLTDEFLLVPATVWAALRFGLRGATASGMAVALATFWATAHGTGPFGGGPMDPWSASLTAEIYVGVALTTNLVLASVVEERRRASEALRRSQRALRLLDASLDRAVDYLCCVTPGGRLVYANETLCRLLQRPRAAVQGRLLWEVFADPSMEQWREIWREVQRSGSSTYELSMAPLGGGEGQSVEVRSSLVRFGDQDYCVSTGRDLRERKQAEAALRMAGVGTLAAGMAHEINNPLAYVLGNLSWLREQLGQLGESLPPGAGGERLLGQLQQVLRETEEGTERVRVIVRDLRLFSRAAEEEPSGTTDVRRALRSAVSLAQNELRHRARLVTELAEVPPVAGNEHRLGQVFLNLLVNAAQSIPEGHADENVVRLSAQATAAGEVVVEVEDSGCGMTAEVRNRIFEPFFTTKPVGSGTGLGLAICHGIVTAIGGRIEVESVPGAGSLFRLVLPAAREEARPVPAAPAALPSPPGRVLVLDDDPLVGRVIGRILDRQHVVALTSPRDALERLAREEFDLVLCDLMMPDMTGMEFHAQLAQLRPALAESLVFMTGGAFTQQARDFLERSPNVRLEKPFDPVALRESVGRALSRRRAAPAAGG
ncbi:MAG TPA: MASE1 domain-containing protein [Anaeromyxobacteraceae bacterium]|jgi:PAS domain S-box-containing protein|nr:MASE1 domain-containing protein [Anaeromyxobacteraceae bacterium]